MFWTIVGALLFVFVGIPLILGILASRIFWIGISTILGLLGLYLTYSDNPWWLLLALPISGIVLFSEGESGSKIWEEIRDEFYKTKVK